MRKPLTFACPETAADTAYHEAGHWFAGEEHGKRPLRVVIYPNMDGVVRFSRVARYIAEPAGELVMLVAGFVAETLRREARKGPGPFRHRPGPMGHGLHLAYRRYVSRNLWYNFPAPSKGDYSQAENCAVGVGMFDWWPKDGTSPDWPQCQSLAARAARRAEEQARELLIRRWEEVRAVAEALLISPGGVLTRKEVAALLRRGS